MTSEKNNLSYKRRSKCVLSDKEKKSAYDKLTPQRQRLVDTIMANLKNNKSLWRQGWQVAGAPISAISGKRYNGVNRLFLSIATMERGYSDNRWLTYNQMKEKGWEFKRDGENNSLGKNAGVSIEYFSFYDKATKQKFDKHTLDGMTEAERDDYMDENVIALRKYYCVFNGDVIEGIPKREKREIDRSGENKRAEGILQYWSDNESKIIYGGDEAFYRPSTDEIHLPERNAFVDLPEFYSTALHEVGHSTGHEKRLNRDLSGGFGSEKYAEEELRAEIASMFLEQDLGIEAGEKHIQNNSAYIQAWHDKIKDDPNILFRAITDAEKITQFVIAKESEIKKQVEPYAIIEDENESGEKVYKVRMVAEYGQTQLALSGYPFRSREALMTEFGKMQEMPFWSGKEFKEVTLDELEAESRKRAEEQNAKVERLREIEEEQSEVFMPPSEVAAEVAAEAAVVGTVAAVEMTGRGIESLTRMDDRDVIDKASKTKHGDKFLALFNGESVLGTEEQNERSLMARLAMHTGENTEQLLRIFRASGQFRDSKPNAYYEQMAKDEMKFVAGLKKPMPTTTAAKNTGSRFTNTKS